MFNRLDWVQIWEPIQGGKERRVLFRLGSGFMTVYDNTFHLDAARTKPNHYEVATQNVDSFRLYLNDQMVDFTKAVTVSVNKRGGFEGMVKPDVEEMLKDQLLLGRGWRYFTAVIDINVVPHPPPKATTKPATKPASPPGVLQPR